MHNIKRENSSSLEKTALRQESIYTTVGEQKLHLRRFYHHTNGPAVWMVHGSVEDGHIFYSSSGKGLAPFLAKQGYNVFVVDLRGRGKSTPKVDATSKWGLSEILEKDFAAYLSKIIEIKGPQPQHWIAHSWGGVLMLAWLARHTPAARVTSMVFFGSKRHISIFNFKKLLQIDFGWNFLSRLLVKHYGYLPGKRFRIGSESESARSYRETFRWVADKEWLDWHDGFNYKKALKKKGLPPALYLTGANDKVLGHYKDVARLIAETGSDRAKLQIIGKKEGFLHDYDHINLLTHPDATRDHFQLILRWMQKHKL
ncbi:alpha/beta fold hydrolase [Nafulsella turpanensis]|uniref:alpha/beta fold hydrolase n=1 Tax=Nafulsella turpanensis TaxID=1265690 RepID=UPI00034C9C02|nr:alpha/beta fold hydrolase [Nafulsella turpanensis]